MQKINFQNLPSTTTPVNATNLNQLQTNVENALPTMTTLYTGNANTGTIQLSDSTANYDFIDIVYNAADGNSYVNTTRIYDANGKNTYLEYKTYSGNSIYTKISFISMSTNTLTISGGYEYYFNTNSSSQINTSSVDYIYIKNVIGYKY